jgi:hypothetical protein
MTDIPIIPEKDPNQLFCLCKKRANNLMIQCDKCDEWFHFGCVGMTKEKAKNLDSYYCPNCDRVLYLYFILFFFLKEQNTVKKKKCVFRICILL